MRPVIIIAILSVLGLLPANAESVIYEMTSGIFRNCNDAVSSVDMVMESATAALRGATSISVKSVCKCQEDGAGNCTKDGSGNESWSVTMQWVK